MALSILDGTQTATTLSTILSSGQHITAHTVVSLGSQAISDITSAVSSGISISGTVTANLGLMQSVVATEGVSASSTFVKIGGHQDGANTTGHIAHVSSGGALKVDGSGSTQPISGTITIGNTVTIAGTVTANPTGTQTIAGSVTIGAGTSQIGSVTASISGTVPVSGTFYQATQPVSLATLPSLVAGTAQIGSVTASISGTIPVSISSVTIGNSLTIGSIVTHGVTIANTSVTVNGTFYQATQPISISSVTIGNFPATQPVSIASVTIGNSLTIGYIVGGLISTVGYASAIGDGDGNVFGIDRDFPVNGSVAILAGASQIGSVTASLAVGTNRIGVVTIGGGTVTIGAGTAQIGSVTASISGTVPISISSVTIGSAGFAKSTGVVSMPTQAVLLGFGYDSNQNFVGVNDDAPLPVQISLPIPAGTNQIGSVTASISNSLTISSLPAISGTVTANTGLTQPLTNAELRASSFNVSVYQPSSLSRIGVNLVDASGTGNYGTSGTALKVSGSVTLGAGTAQIGSVTIGNSITIGSLPALVAGTAKIGSVTASLSNYNIFSSDEGGAQPDLGIQLGFSTQTAVGEDYVRVAPSNPLPVVANAGDTSFFVSGLDVYAHRSVLYSSSGNGFNNDAGAPVDIDNPLPIVGRALQGTSVTTSNFTSTTPSTVLANFNATRQVLSIFNEGAGNLHVCAGATCTTIAYQVRLSAGDYYEVPNHQTTITHSAVFAVAGTARVTQVS